MPADRNADGEIARIVRDTPRNCQALAVIRACGISWRRRTPTFLFSLLFHMNHPSRTIFAALLVVSLILGIALWQPAVVQMQQAAPALPSTPLATTAPAERVLIDAYDAAQVNGLVLISGNPNSPDQNIFGLRVVTYQQGEEGLEATPRLFELGPHASDGSYARVSWRPQSDPKLEISLRWSRTGSRTVIGQLTASSKIRIAVEAYRPWNAASALPERTTWTSFAAQPDRRGIIGEQIHNQKNKPPLRQFLWRADRAGLEAANYNNETTLRAMLLKGLKSESHLPALRSAVTFEIGPDAPLGFAAIIGDDSDAMQKDVETLLQKRVTDLMNKAESDYDANRTLSGGVLGEGLDAMNRATMWNRLYSSGQRYEYITMHRHSDRGLRGDVLGWDSLLMTAMTGLTDGASAMASLRVLLAGQTFDGRIPLRRYLQNDSSGEPPVLTGRSMPPLGALCALKAYMTTQDLEFLAWAYPRLQQWNDWWMRNRGDGQPWRDGNKDGLLEWGFDADVEYGSPGAQTFSNAEKRQMAFDESGFSDRSQWLNTAKPKPNGPAGPAAEVKYNDQTHTLEFSSVALNALYAMDTELMISISREIGLTTEADRWQHRYDEIKRLMNEKLWSEEDGLYLDRHWDGRFSQRISLENFYPLLAGIPDEAKAKRMLAVLRDQRKFGGLQLLPSVPRDDAAFVEKPSEQTAATGAAQAAMNYLLYLGLKRYGFYDEAEGLARQSLHAARSVFERQGEQAVKRKGTLFDLFASPDGQPIDEALTPQRASFTGLMFLPAVEELISADPWQGLTIGSLVAPEEARVERVMIAGENMDVMIGPKRTVVRRGDKSEIEFEAPVRLRSYRSTDRTLTFTVEARSEVRALVPPAEGRKVTVSVNDKVLGSTSPGASASFKVKEGLSKILIVR